MKRLMAMITAALISLSLAACGGQKVYDSSDASGDQNSSVKSSLELLTAVWDSYGEDEKFSAAGGDMSEENMTMDAPGTFSVDDAAALDATLGFPGADAGKIDDAASLMHMMNANTFTCGAFHLKNQEDAADISNAIKDNILNRQWMCGFPDKLVIVKADDYIVSFFGENEIVDTFKEKLSAAYDSAEIVCEEPIA